MSNYFNSSMNASKSSIHSKSFRGNRPQINLQAKFAINIPPRIDTTYLGLRLVDQDLERMKEEQMLKL